MSESTRKSISKRTIKPTTKLLQRLLSSPDAHSPSKVAIRISMWTIAVATMTLALALSITNGYETTLKAKLSENLGDITLHYRNPLNNWSLQPAAIDSNIQKIALSTGGVKSISPHLTRGVVLKNGGAIAGVELNGIDSLQTKFGFQTPMPSDHNGIVISKSQAIKLGAKIGDTITLFILTTPFPTEVNVTVVDTFEVGMEEIDDLIAWTDRSFLAGTLSLPPNFADGYSVGLEPVMADDLEGITNNLDEALTTYPVAIETTQDRFAHIYDWLSLLDNNVTLLIIIVSFVIAINIIASVLIIVLESTQKIGILLSLGMRSRQIERIFILKTFTTAFKGATLGLHIAIFTILLQRYTHFIALDPGSYIVSYLPMDLDLLTILGAFLGIVGLATLFSMLPAMIISRTEPTKALKFD